MANQSYPHWLICQLLVSDWLIWSLKPHLPVLTFICIITLLVITEQNKLRSADKLKYYEGPTSKFCIAVTLVNAWCRLFKPSTDSDTLLNQISSTKKILKRTATTSSVPSTLLPWQRIFTSCFINNWPLRQNAVVCSVSPDPSQTPRSDVMGGNKRGGKRSDDEDEEVEEDISEVVCVHLRASRANNVIVHFWCVCSSVTCEI